MQYKDYDPKLFKMKRKILNITCPELGDICRCTRQTINNIDAGRSKSKSIITFIGYTLDILAEERGYTEIFEILEKNNSVN